ncbi:hypothetical protein C8F01DRAFT_464415 [Mycena amicta]|nr:hypothetical protein C8F01DRAFT_464415 [Mycena amicta]
MWRSHHGMDLDGDEQREPGRVEREREREAEPPEREVTVSDGHRQHLARPVSPVATSALCERLRQTSSWGRRPHTIDDLHHSSCLYQLLLLAYPACTAPRHRSPVDADNDLSLSHLSTGVPTPLERFRAIRSDSKRPVSYAGHGTASTSTWDGGRRIPRQCSPLPVSPTPRSAPRTRAPKLHSAPRTKLQSIVPTAQSRR